MVWKEYVIFECALLNEAHCKLNWVCFTRLVKMFRVYIKGWWAAVLEVIWKNNIEPRNASFWWYNSRSVHSCDARSALFDLDIRDLRLSNMSFFNGILSQTLMHWKIVLRLIGTTLVLLFSAMPYLRFLYYRTLISSDPISVIFSIIWAIWFWYRNWLEAVIEIGGLWEVVEHVQDNIGVS